MDFVYYRGYFIDVRGEASCWRFMAAPTFPDVPILSRSISQQFSSAEEAVAKAKKQIDRLLAG